MDKLELTKELLKEFGNKVECYEIKDKISISLYLNWILLEQVDKIEKPKILESINIITAAVSEYIPKILQDIQPIPNSLVGEKYDRTLVDLLPMVEGIPNPNKLDIVFSSVYELPNWKGPKRISIWKIYLDSAKVTRENIILIRDYMFELIKLEDKVPILVDLNYGILEE